MAPAAATLVCIAGVAVLFAWDRDRTRRVSPALWLAVAWLVIAGSRLPSEWVVASSRAQVGTSLDSPEHYLEGSPLDRVLLTGLLAAGVAVVVGRHRRASDHIRANLPVAIFFAYAAVSILWSDFPDVAFKRWTKALGDVVMVLIVLTDPAPREAFKQWLARAGFLLLPLSALLIKYFPDYGRGYNPWSWTPFYTGASTTKNGLGYICLIFGLASLWRLIGTRIERPSTERAHVIAAHAFLLALTLWLFVKADSATSLFCFLLGAALIVVTTREQMARRPAAVLFVFGMAVGSVYLLMGGADVAEAMGRDATLSGRTELWGHLLSMPVDRFLGAGFESFWLGPRVEQLWRIYWWHPNQAHNGYLELFLNLGCVGLVLLAAVIVGGYRRIAEGFRTDAELARIRLAFLVVVVAFNLTEAAFRMMHPVWIILLASVMANPSVRSSRYGEPVR